jgi:hypothetical protein
MQAMERERRGGCEDEPYGHRALPRFRHERQPHRRHGSVGRSSRAERRVQAGASVRRLIPIARRSTATSPCSAMKAS